MPSRYMADTETFRRHNLQLALQRAEAAAVRRPPGLVQRNWDLEASAVTIDHDTTATDLITTLVEQHDIVLEPEQAREAIAYALEGNTDAVLI